MFNVRLAGGHLYGKQLFTWLSLVVSFVLSFFPLDVLDEIWDLIESVSEGFLTYSYSLLLFFLLFIHFFPFICPLYHGIDIAHRYYHSLYLTISLPFQVNLCHIFLKNY